MSPDFYLREISKCLGPHLLVDATVQRFSVPSSTLTVADLLCSPLSKYLLQVRLGQTLLRPKNLLFLELELEFPPPRYKPAHA